VRLGGPFLDGFLRVIVPMSAFGPSVWTGRALQAENDDLEKCWSCASVSGLLMERSAPGHHGYSRAPDLIRVSAPKAIRAT
jgi:hypothetical protein